MSAFDLPISPDSVCGFGLPYGQSSLRYARYNSHIGSCGTFAGLVSCNSYTVHIIISGHTHAGNAENFLLLDRNPSNLC